MDINFIFLKLDSLLEEYIAIDKVYDLTPYIKNIKSHSRYLTTFINAIYAFNCDPNYGRIYYDGLVEIIEQSNNRILFLFLIH